MRSTNIQYGFHLFLFSAIGLVTVFFSGCHEGPLWQTGKYVPWARNKWAEEERIANSIFTRKDEMNRMVSAAKMGTMEDRQAAAKKLAETINRDSILLMRLHAVKLIGDLDCPEAITTLESASMDNDSSIRIAAIQSWSKMPGEVAISRLQEMIGSDTDDDVRLAATRALGNFQGVQAVRALSLALEDPNPALQMRATESLAKATGESLGRDVQAWQRYIEQSLPAPKMGLPTENQSQQRTANQGDSDSIFR